MRALPIVAVAAIGVTAGLGLSLFRYAEGLSYLSTDPKACANCHIMQPQYDSWQSASHHTSATCVDCHLPADFIGKYVAKAENGWNHSKAFTLQDFPEPIRIGAKNAAILQQNCERCHSQLLSEASAPALHGAPNCVRCHDTVGHGDTIGLGGPMALHADENSKETRP